MVEHDGIVEVSHEWEQPNKNKPIRTNRKMWVAKAGAPYEDKSAGKSNQTRDTLLEEKLKDGCATAGADDQRWADHDAAVGGGRAKTAVEMKAKNASAP